MNHLCSYDCHTHFVPRFFPPYAGKFAGAPWPQVSPIDCGHAQVSVSGKPFRRIGAASWDKAIRVEHMSRTKVDVQVVSPMPELLSYWLEPEDGAAMCGFLNEQIGNLVRSAPSKFIGLGVVPLQDVHRACRQLEELMKVEGFAGVEIGTNVNGVPIGDPSLDEFFATASELNASVFVHALRPIGDERITGPMSLRAVVSFPCEVSFAISSAITGGLMARHPTLKIAFSHGGGAFGSVLPRLAHAWAEIASIHALMEEDPRVTAGRFFYDTLVYSAKTLSHLIELFGASQFIAGSDYPFDIADPEPVVSVRQGVSSSVADLILRGNAERFLGVAHTTHLTREEA